MKLKWSEPASECGAYMGTLLQLYYITDSNIQYTEKKKKGKSSAAKMFAPNTSNLLYEAVVLYWYKCGIPL